jgi:UDP-glucose:(glucosyl)LPS beta-1,3-glucosyltransferase
MTPLLSIIIPAYNSEKYIHNTLSMLVVQGLDDCEVIVVNDGSTDNTGEICKSFAACHHHISIISLEKNSGVSVARNTGLAEAKGKYICFFDSDDVFPPDTLSFFKETINKQGNLDVFCFGFEIRRNEKEMKRYAYRKYSGRLFTESFEYLRLTLRKNINCCCPGTLISRKLLQSNKITFIEGMSIGEDLEFMIRVFYCSKSVYYDSKVCYVYYLLNDSTTKGYKSYSIQQFNAYTVIYKYLQEVMAKNSGLLKSAYFYLANLYTANLYFYLKSDIKDNAINHLFLENKKILYKSYSGQTDRLLLFCILRFIPIRLLFCIFRKN